MYSYAYTLLRLLQMNRRVDQDTSPVRAATDAVSDRVGCVMEIMTVVTTVMNRTAVIRFHFFLVLRYFVSDSVNLCT